MVSMDDVANRAKVSKATVSRVFNGHPGVSSTTRNRVLSVCSELNYKLNSSIQDLTKKSRNGYTSNIAFVLVDRDFSNPAYVEMVNPMANEAINRQQHLMLVRLTGAERSVYDLPPALRDNRVDGIVISGNINAEVVAVLEQLGTPAVIAGNYDPEITRSLNVVYGDSRRPILKALDECFGKGIKRLAFVEENPAAYHAQKNYAVYRDALKMHGRELDESIVYWGKGFKLGVFDTLIDIFSAGELPFDAIMALDFRVANEICHLFACHFGFAKDRYPYIVTTEKIKYFTLPAPVIQVDEFIDNMIHIAVNVLESLQNGEQVPSVTIA